MQLLPVAKFKSEKNSLDPREKYRELLTDFCHKILTNSGHVEQALKEIHSATTKRKGKDQFQNFERAWVLFIASQVLQNFENRYGYQIRPSSQFHFDVKMGPDERLEHFDYYFHRLPIQDRILFLLKDRYELELPEISAILGIPTSSIKLRRQQILRTLEDWIWEQQS